MTEESPPASALVRLGNVVFRYRNGVFPIVLVVLLIALPPRYPFGSAKANTILNAIGFAVALAGQALRVAVIGFAYIVRGGRDRRVYAEDLVTGGFFAHARNPLYVGNILVLIGLFLIQNNWITYAIGLPFFLVSYVAIVAAEEAFLAQKFGDAYRQYMQSVPRWIPNFRGLRASVSGMQFDWRRVIRKEYGSTFAWMATALAILTSEMIRYDDGATRDRSRTALIGCFVLLTALYATARYLKKTRRLQTAG